MVPRHLRARGERGVPGNPVPVAAHALLPGPALGTSAGNWMMRSTGSTIVITTTGGSIATSTGHAAGFMTTSGFITTMTWR